VNLEMCFVMVVGMRFEARTEPVLCGSAFAKLLYDTVRFNDTKSDKSSNATSHGMKKKATH
jgi:hypothetical protein